MQSWTFLLNCIDLYSFLYFRRKFLKWDGKKYDEVEINGKTFRFDGKSFFLRKCVWKQQQFFSNKISINDP